MPSQNPCDSSHRDRVSTGGPPTLSGVLAQSFEERDRRRAHVPKLVDQRTQGAGPRVGVTGPVVLVKARKRRFVRPRHRQSPVGEHAFGICNVADDLTDGPLAGRIGERLEATGHLIERFYETPALRPQRLDDGAIRYLLDVRLIELEVLVASWPIEHHLAHGLQTLSKLSQVSALACHDREGVGPTRQRDGLRLG